VQESVLIEGEPMPIDGQRRLALQFIPPSSVRIGSYSDASRVVEAESVSSSDYQTLQNRSVAQFGAYTARVEDGQLVTFLNGEESGRFRRQQGKSVFPPLVKLPKLVHASPSGNESLMPTPIGGDLASAPRSAGPSLAAAAAE
jgi:hypothetical protein